MKHVRQQLRELARRQITEALGLTRCKVERARGYARIPSQMPVIEVGTPSEDVSGVTQDEMMQRQVELQITIMVNAAESAEDEADALAVYVERAIAFIANDRLVKDVEPQGMAFEVSGDGENRVGRMILTYAVEIHTAENNPTSHI